MMFRNGEGLSDEERDVLGKCLEDQIAIRGLFMETVRHLGEPRSSSDVFRSYRDGSSNRLMQREFWPVPLRRPGKRKQSITLADTTILVRKHVHEAALESTAVSESTVWAGGFSIREGKKVIERVEFPRLITWEYHDGSDNGADWQFSESEEVLALLAEDLARRESEITLYRLQNLVNHMRGDTRQPPV